MREQHCRQTKVDYLNLGLPTSCTRLCCEDVIKLEVSVHYALRVQVSCSTAYLLEHPDSLNLSLLWQLVLPLHDPVYKWLTCNALHNNCELFFFVDDLYELWEDIRSSGWPTALEHTKATKVFSHLNAYLEEQTRHNKVLL